MTVSILEINLRRCFANTICFLMFRMAGHVNDIIISVIPEVVECLGRTVNSRYAVLQTSTLSSISTCKNQELSDKVISEMSYSDLVVFFYLVWNHRYKYCKLHVSGLSCLLHYLFSKIICILVHRMCCI